MEKSLRQPYSAEVWKTRIASCRSSGLNVKTWCAENAVKIQTYYKWESKLLLEAEKQRTPAVNGRFAELPIASMPDSDAVVAVIRAKGMECEIRGGISEEILSLLVRIMSGHA